MNAVATEAPILAEIASRHMAPLSLIAIDGHSAAGKSTLAQIIANTLPNVSIVHTDDFYRVMGAGIRAQLDAQGGYERYYDWQRLEAQVLAPLAAGQIARYQKYDWAANQLGQWDEVHPQGVVLVEGCYSARPNFRPYYSLIVLVEADADLRDQRQQQRADAPEWWPRWDAAERYYMQTARPREYADFVLRKKYP